MRVRMMMTAAAFLMAAQLLGAQELALSTNVLGYADFGTMNVEASYALSQHWSATAGVGYNPFSFTGKDGGQMQSRRQEYSLGARFWPWHIFSGWWLAGKMQYQEYNRGGIRSPETSEGDRVGAGLSAGYTYMLGAHFNVEMGIGLWGGYDRYTTYDCPVCGKVVASGGRSFVLPNDFLLSLIYVF